MIDAIDALLGFAKADGAMRPGHKYFKREATGNAEHPWKYYYTEDEYRQAKGGGKDEQKGRRKGGEEGTEGTGGKEQAELERLSATLEQFEAAIGAGTVKGDLSEHIRVAQREVAAHEKALPALMSELTALAKVKPGAKVKARVKKLESVLGKILRKPKYKDASDLQDLTGARIVHKDVAAVMATVKAIKAKYKVVTEDNYIDKPLGDYRSYHLIIEHEGQQKEIQVRTKNQDMFADFSHLIYKPLNPQQEQAIRTARTEVESYSKQAAAHFWDLDNGKDPPIEPPPCIPVIAQSFGCLEFAA